MSVIGFIGFFSLNFLLTMENNNSKQGYHNKTITKYGEISGLLDEKFIKKKPVSNEIKYAPRIAHIDYSK